MSTKEGVKHVAWDADIVDGKTSWDVLLQWLADGNYDRWVGDVATSKKGLCRELFDHLQTRGYRGRSMATTFSKIWTMERSVAHAKHLLEQSGLESLESCDEQLKKNILRHCPHFEQLAPIMKSLKSCPMPSFSSKKHRDQSAAGPKRKRTKRLSLQADAAVSTAGEEGVEHASSGDESPFNDDDDSLNAIDDEELSEEDDGEPLREDDTEAVEMHLGQNGQAFSASSFDLSPLQQQELEDRCMRFEQRHERIRIELESERKKRDLELEAMRKKHDSELEALRQKLEIDVETAREKCKIDLEQAQCDLRLTRDVNASSLVMERALSRQKLIKAGLSQKEVDRILPSKACRS